MAAVKLSKRKKKTVTFDKHDLYVNSVQSAEHDASLIWEMYRDANKHHSKQKILLREDFCGTGALCYEWANLSENHHAMGIDIDRKALLWGQKHHSAQANSRHLIQPRVKLICEDVHSAHGYQSDIICALNFSYYFLKERLDLLHYFKLCQRRLAKNGLFILDAFGGPEYLGPHCDKRRNSERKFTFWWEVESFDAISHAIKTHIHFKLDGQKIRKRVFSYDWRLWTLPEISDLLFDAGFKSTEFWAEGLDRRGRGNGRFRKIKSEKNCDTWVTYITAKK
jgi:SAM-dependent methyltransferase